MKSFVFSKLSPDPCKRSLIVEAPEKKIVLCFSDNNVRKQATTLTHLSGVVIELHDTTINATLECVL